MQILLLLIIGAAAGFLATKFMKIEASVPATIAIGVLGALVGGLVLRVLASALGAAFGFLGAVVGAVLLIWLWQKYFER
ncbi:MAG: GlsB/YeaQ/YmgE family stress response membrane protein [Rhodobacteraceae bacterium]|nr:GlsB/YeaQ/YmgE family stress response membrane protein [Paracoccaceae bacterium]